MEENEAKYEIKELTRPTAAILLPFTFVSFLWATEALPPVFTPFAALILVLNALFLLIRSYLVSCSIFVDEEKGRLFYQYFWGEKKLGGPSAVDDSEEIVALHHHRFLNNPHLEEWIFIVFASSARLLIFDRCANGRASGMTPLEVKELIARLARALDCPVEEIEGRERPEAKRKKTKKEEVPTSFEVMTRRGTEEWRTKVALIGHFALGAPLLFVAYGAYLGINAIYPTTLFILLASWWVSETPLAWLYYFRHVAVSNLAPLLPTEVLVFDGASGMIRKRFENWQRSNEPKGELNLSSDEIVEVRLVYSPFEELYLVRENSEELPVFSRNPVSPLALGSTLTTLSVEPLARKISRFTNKPLVVEVRRG